MTWQNRLRLFGGMVLVLTVTAALVLLFNQRQARALSVTGQVVAAQYSVGAAYGGVVVSAMAEQGDMVTRGEPLFTVTSPGLQYDLSNGVKAVSGDAYTVNGKAGTVTYTALAPGRLDEVTAEIGAYVQNGGDLARIRSVGSEYAVAEFVLAPRDYDRVEKGAQVDLRLPDDSTVTGAVDDVSVRTVGGRAITTVTITSPALQRPTRPELSASGTPVSATLHLRDDGPLAGVGDRVTDFLLKVGLR